MNIQRFSKYMFLSCLVLCLLAASCQEEKQMEMEAPQPLTGPYLGEQLPGQSPLLFAEGLVSGPVSERDVAITADGKELYYGVLFGRFVTIMVIRELNGVWAEPEVASFARDTRFAYLEPALSADGNRMMFLSNRPLDLTAEPQGWRHSEHLAGGPGRGWGMERSGTDAGTDNG